MELFTKSETEIATTVTGLVKKAESASSSWRNRAREDFEFVAGKQWPLEDEMKLKEENRPPITFNRIAPIISAIVGIEANQRQEVKFTPRGNEDAGISEALTLVDEQICDGTGISFEEAQSFEDTIVCGMGWTDSRMNYDRNLDGEIIQENVYPLEMFWDTTARKRNLKDARWVAQAKQMTIDEIMATWPDANRDEILVSISLDVDQPAETHVTNPQTSYTQNESNEGTNHLFRVIKFEWHENKPWYRVASNTTGKIFEADGDKFSKIKPLIDSKAMAYVKQTKKFYYQAFVVGNTVLEKKESPCQNGFTLKCITGKQDRITGEWYGIVRDMKDPAQWSNKFFSQFLDILAANSKGGIMYEEGSIGDIRKFEENWAKSNSAIKFNAGALTSGKVQPKPQPPYPQGVDRLLEYSVNAIYQVAGVNMEMLGLAEADTPGVVVESRKRSAFTILGRFFDSLSMYRRDAALVRLEYLIKYIPESRMAEILSPEYQQYIPQIKALDLRQTDVVVSESPQSDNNKWFVWQFVSQVVPQLMQLGMPVPPEILDYTPLPEPLTTKWKELIASQSQKQPDPAQEAQQQLILAGLQAGVEKTQAETQKIAVDTGKIAADTERIQISAAQGAAEIAKGKEIYGTLK